MNNEAVEFYTQKVAGLAEKLKVEQKRKMLLYVLRLVSFVVFITFAICYFQQFVIWQFFLCILALLLFIVSIRIDQQNNKAIILINSKIRICNNELFYLSHNYSFASTGDEFAHLNPTLSADFELLGKGSLFQYLNRSATKIGAYKFAKSLLQFYRSKPEIIDRQLAIEELSLQSDFLIMFRAIGLQIDEDGCEVDNLQKWLNQSDTSLKCLNFYCSFVLIFNLLWITLIALGFMSVGSLVVMFFVSYTFVLIAGKRVDYAYVALGRASNIFQKYGLLIKLIEKKEFKSNYLQAIQNQFKDEKSDAFVSLQKLHKLLQLFDMRYNILASLILNSLVGFNLLIYRKLVYWKLSNRKLVMRWFEALSNFDSLIGFSTYSFNNGNTLTLPEINDTNFFIDAHEMGHPLIKTSSRVCNTFKMCDLPIVVVITGANMAGKSTFLRTLAVNIILAINGAKVCAKRFVFSPCSIMSSIKNNDSLAKNESFFYSELGRLKGILQFVQQNPNTLIIFDEILRGTNSKDKQIGSMGLLRKVIAQKAAVIIATHDLTIATLAQEYPDFVHNHCFEVELKSNHLVFDYKIKDGVSQKLNATFLMKQMGIIDC